MARAEEGAFQDETFSTLFSVLCARGNASSTFTWGGYLERSEFGAFLTRSYVKSCRKGAGCLGLIVGKLMVREVKTHRVTSLRYAMTRRWFQALLTVASLFFWAWLAWYAGSTMRPTASSKAFRLVSLEERSGAVATSPGVLSFGMLLDGCMQEWQNASISVEGATMTIRSADEVGMNGWYFVPATGPGARQQDPVRFFIKAAVMDGEKEKWVGVGAASWSYHGGYNLLPNARAFRETYDAREPMYSITFSYLRNSCLGISATVGESRPLVGRVVGCCRTCACTSRLETGFIIRKLLCFAGRARFSSCFVLHANSLAGTLHVS